MRKLILAVLLISALSACASTSTANSQFYGEIKGGMETSNVSVGR